MSVHPTRIALLAALLLLGRIPPAQAQSVAIGSPSHGALLLDTSAFYRGSPDYDVEVRGTVILPPGSAKNYTLLVHGQRAKTSAGMFQARVWVGPWDGPAGPPPPWYPYLHFFRDPQHIQKPIIVELIEKKSKAVVSRDRIVLFDGRFDAFLDPQFGGTSVDEAMHVQIPASGLDALEVTHLTSLPDPTLSAFNGVLREQAAGTTLEVATDTGSGGACIPLGDAPNGFLATSAYVAAFVHAQTRYLARQAVERSQSFVGVLGLPGAAAALGTQAYLTNECVQQQPTVSTFEICVGRIEGEITDLSTAGVLDVNLSYGPGVLAPASHDDVLADVDLDAIDGTVEGRLRDVFIRWSEQPPGCSPALIPVPKETLSDSELVASEDRDAWATCSGLEVDAAAAHLGPTTDGPFHVDPLALDDNSAHFGVMLRGDPEQLDVSGEGGVDFTLDAVRTKDPDAGTCAEGFVRAKVLELLDLFYPAIEQAVGEAWNDGATATQQARALAALLSPLQIGTFEPFDHELQLDYTLLRTVDTAYSAMPSHDGLLGAMRTDARLSSGFTVVQPPTKWVYSPPGVLLDMVSTDGRDPFNDRFDVAFGLSTGALNQVLRERSAAEWMRFEWKPTWADLGLAPPTGAQPEDQATLDGAVLAAAVDPALATLGSWTLSVVAQPTLLPFTWIPPDPFSVPAAMPPFEWGRAPFTYQLSQFLVDVYSTDPTNPHPIQIAIDFYDDDFGFGFSAPEQNLLVPALGNAEWTTIALEWNVPGCLRAPMAPLANPPLCGGLVTAALANIFIPLLEGNMLGMLSDVPAPLLFDAAGAGLPRTFSSTDTFVGLQRAIFYGRLE
jgi:hypothetical protein